jgi:hypothetical protein
MGAPVILCHNDAASGAWPGGRGHHSRTLWRLYLLHLTCRLQGEPSGPKPQSEYIGVVWSDRHGKWRAEVSTRRARIDLGCFESEKDAAVARDREVMRLLEADPVRLQLGLSVNQQQISRCTVSCRGSALPCPNALCHTKLPPCLSC